LPRFCAAQNRARFFAMPCDEDSVQRCLSALAHSVSDVCVLLYLVDDTEHRTGGVAAMHALEQAYKDARDAVLEALGQAQHRRRVGLVPWDHQASDDRGAGVPFPTWRRQADPDRDLAPASAGLTASSPATSPSPARSPAASPASEICADGHATPDGDDAQGAGAEDARTAKRTRLEVPAECVDCGCTQSPMWRRVPGEHWPQPKKLCNACGVRRKRQRGRSEQRRRCPSHTA
jgi:hypothetical protein